MRYGFVIDQDRCIGCHACTVACKEEHNVPIGVFRTWVKYLEKGEFPEVRRHFGVMRCNHCDDAPCIEICPTTSLFRRDNGIVDFDSTRCIGCKSCMQACPYDAIYIDPNTSTAAKCNYCAHRVELSLEPACVIVCPTEAIISGDLDDPLSKPARIVATQKVTSRKPHKGTHPKLFYVGIDGDLLNPTAPATSRSFMWSDGRKQNGIDGRTETLPEPDHASGTRIVYDTHHRAPWGWKIGAYLWSKSVAAGALLVAVLLTIVGGASDLGALNLLAPSLALGFTALTGVLLIADLKRPDRFYYLFAKSNFSSWVVLGAYILGAYGLFGFLWLVTAFTGGTVPLFITLPTAALAVASAGYSAFLFAQAKGRDLWQSPIFGWHLIAQAVVGGAAVLLTAGIFSGSPGETVHSLSTILAISLGWSLAMIVGEISLQPVSEEVRIATEMLTRGAKRGQFWLLSIGLGTVVPLILLIFGGYSGATDVIRIVAAALALGGIWIFEDLWVRAGQAAPLS